MKKVISLLLVLVLSIGLLAGCSASKGMTLEKGKLVVVKLLKKL